MIEFYIVSVDEMWLILYLQTIKIDQLKLGNIPKCVKFKIKVFITNIFEHLKLKFYEHHTNISHCFTAHFPQ